MQIKDSYDYLVHLLRSSLFNEKIIDCPDSIKLEDVYVCAKRHKVSALCFDAVKEQIINNNKLYNAWKKDRDFSVYRSTLQMCERDKLVDFFTKSGIFFLEAQGTTVRNYYPNPLLRSMADIDFIVDINQLSKVGEYLNISGYDIQNSYKNEIVAISNQNVSIEIHTDFFRDDTVLFGSMPYIKNCFDNQEKRISDTYLYLYTLLHAIKHLQNGGCGIRRVLDIYILKNKLERVDYNIVNNILEERGFFDTAYKLIALSNYWFEGGEYNDELEKLAEYVKSGRAHGTLENKLSHDFSNDNKPFKKLKFVFSRIFPPYIFMKKRFPFLNKFPIALPFLWVYRAFMAIFKDSKRIRLEIKSIKKSKSHQK